MTPIYCGNIQIAIGYFRIVIGDYGAYVEIPELWMFKNKIKIKPHEEYRLELPYNATVKYLWYCPTFDEDIKIYYQLRKVEYADYKPGYYYIAPDSCSTVSSMIANEFLF